MADIYEEASNGAHKVNHRTIDNHVVLSSLDGRMCKGILQGLVTELNAISTVNLDRLYLLDCDFHGNLVHTGIHEAPSLILVNSRVVGTIDDFKSVHYVTKRPHEPKSVRRFTICDACKFYYD